MTCMSIKRFKNDIEHIREEGKDKCSLNIEINSTEWLYETRTAVGSVTFPEFPVSLREACLPACLGSMQ